MTLIRKVVIEMIVKIVLIVMLARLVYNSRSSEYHETFMARKSVLDLLMISNLWGMLVVLRMNRNCLHICNQRERERDKKQVDL